MSLRRRLLFSIFLIMMVIAFGTAGYSVLEGWSLFDSLYMTVITLTTVGYEEVHSLTRAGRVFTVILILFGLGAMLYTLNFAARIIIEGELKNVFWRKKLQDTIDKLTGHYIICGYGRMGRIICEEMKKSGTPFVVVEREADVDSLKENGVLVVQGDATRDEILKDAGIERAKGLITVLPSDAENLYVVLSARGIAPTLSIVARAVGEGSEQKLIRAGANRAISPYHIGALRIAHTLLSPTVVDFIEFTTQVGSLDIWMEEIPVRPDSELSGLTLDQCGIGKELGVIIVAIKKQSGKMQINPTFLDSISPGDTLVAIGEASKLRGLKDRARTRAA